MLRLARRFALTEALGPGLSFPQGQSLRRWGSSPVQHRCRHLLGGTLHRTFSKAPEKEAAREDTHDKATTKEEGRDASSWPALALALRDLELAPSYETGHEDVRGFWKQRQTSYANAEPNSRSGMWSIRKMFRSFRNRRLPLRLSFYHGLYSSALTVPFVWAHYYGPSDHVVTQLVEHLADHSDTFQGCTSFLATALFLMLSFRINRATARWWEGRKVYGDLVGNLRNLSQASQVYLKDKDAVADVVVWTYAYARSVEFHLRDLPAERQRAFFSSFSSLSPAVARGLATHTNRPAYLAQQMSLTLTDEFDRGNVKGIRAAVALHEIVQSIVLGKVNLDRLISTPEPWSYQKHMRMTTLLWLGLLPLALLPCLLHLTPVLSWAIGFVVFKLDDVAVELQNPFGWDRSDLHICLLNDAYQQDSAAMLHTFAEHRGCLPKDMKAQREVDHQADTNGLNHSI